MMADARVVGIFDTLSEAEAARRQLTAGGIAAEQIAIVASGLQGTWTAHGYVRNGTAAERGGRYLAVVQGDAAETAAAAQILRGGGAARVDSLAALIREFLLATPAQVGREAAHGAYPPGPG
jgi:hypothetical protein